jgi:hypothetical protein
MHARERDRERYWDRDTVMSLIYESCDDTVADIIIYESYHI